MNKSILIILIFNLSNCVGKGQSIIKCFDHGFDAWKLESKLKYSPDLRVMNENEAKDFSNRFHVPENAIYTIDGKFLKYKYCKLPIPQKVFFIQKEDTIKYIIARFSHNEKLMDTILYLYSTSGINCSVMSWSNMNFEKNDFAIYLDGYIVAITQIFDDYKRPFVDIVIKSRKK